MKWVSTLEEHVRAGRLKLSDAKKIAKILKIDFDMDKKKT